MREIQSYDNQLFHQYIVDVFAKTESERLLYLRLNQKKLRSDEYIHLRDSVTSDADAKNYGKIVVLPSSFQGSPRHLHEYAQDAMTYVRYGGKPSLFITYTFNPKCKEVEENLFDGQTSTDRHDLIARVFRQKLLKFLHSIVKGELFGTVKYWVYSVEWQKRGLPHAHILIWLQDQLHPNVIRSSDRLSIQ